MANRPEPGPGGTWWPVAAALVVLLGLPVLGAVPGNGDLVATGPVRAEGTTTWTADAGLAYLTHDGDATVRWALEGASAVLHEWTWDGAEVGTPITEVRTQPQFNERTRTLGSLRTLDLALANGSAVSLDADGVLEAVLPSALGVRAHEAHVSVDPAWRERAQHDDLLPYSYHRTDVLALDAPTAPSLHATGRLTVAVWNATLIARSEAGAETYRAGLSAEPIGNEQAPADRIVKRVIWIEIDTHTLQAAWPGTVMLLAADPVVQTHGTIVLPAASGRLQGGGTTASPRSADVEITGNVTLASHPGRGTPATPRPDIAVVPYETSAWSATGEFAAVTVAGRPVLAPPAPLDPAAVAVGATGLVAGLAALRYALPFLIGRLSGPSLLSNATRARLYDAVCAEPGLHATELARRTGISPSTAIYHLRVLRANGRVSFLRDGKHYRYFENHGKWDGHQGLVTLLTNPKAALLASTVARNPGMDQASLSETTGLPQSTVSFHLLRLHQCGALRSERTEGAQVKTYHPTETLQATLARLHEASLGPSHAAVGASA